MALLAELICDVPAKGKMQLMSLSASEGLSRPFEYQVEILSDKADLDLAKFLGKSMTVALELPVGTRHFNGLVSRFAHSGRRTRQFFHYQATLRPWFWFLSRTQDCKIFQDKTVVQIIEEVFADHSGIAKFSKKLSGSYTPWEYCVQYRESDMNFVARMMEQEGLYFYFEHTESGHEMVLCDSISAHHAVANYEKLPYESNWSQAHGDQAEGVRSWSVGMQVLPTKVVLADYDFTRPAHDLRKEHSVARQHDQNSYEVFDYPGEFSKDADGQAYAKIRAQEQQAGFRVASAQSDARGITCGSTFKIEGLPDTSQDGEYLVLSTNIFIEEGVQIGGEDGSDGHFSCDFQVMPTADTYRAPRLTPKPMVYGPQTAMVVGPSGEPIYTDKYGRVKVQFHWDRLGQRNDKSSCWMRVSQPWAGKSFGVISIPRIGDEVVVSFLEGDPDQPLITGRVYNEGFLPPYELPANSSVTTILTRSMGSTDKTQANELRFEDKPGKEYIWLQAQKDFHREVENNDYDTVKADQFITVNGKRQEFIEKDLEQRVQGKVKSTYLSDSHNSVGGDLLQSTKGVINFHSDRDFAIDSGANVGVNATSSLEMKAGQDVMAEGGMNVHVKGGMNVTIEAGMTLTLKAGAASIVIGPASISIDGPMVNINCGGGGGSANSASPVTTAAPEEVVQTPADKDPLTAQTSSGKPLSAPSGAAKNQTPVAGPGAGQGKAAPPKATPSAPPAGGAAAATPPAAGTVKSGLGDDVDKIAAKSPSLQKDMKKLQDAGWETSYGPTGGGSYADRTATPPKIVIDGNLKNNPKAATQTLAHEVGHATYPYKADVSSKAAYVNGTLADEGAATMNNIKVQREIVANGGPDIGIAGNSANHAAYNKAYDQFVKDGDAAKARQAAGAIFGNGEKTSTTGQAYADYYGSWYDKTYPPKK